MNFLILKTIVDSTMQNFNQQNPHAPITENHIFVSALTQKGLDLIIRSPHNPTEIKVHAEVNYMNGPLPANFSLAGDGMKRVEWSINDSDVQEVHKALSATSTISDLFGEKE